MTAESRSTGLNSSPHPQTRLAASKLSIRKLPGSPACVQALTAQRFFGLNKKTYQVGHDKNLHSGENCNPMLKIIFFPCFI